MCHIRSTAVARESPAHTALGPYATRAMSSLSTRDCWNPYPKCGFQTATLQNTIFTRIRSSNLATEQLSPRMAPKVRQNVYLSLSKWGVLQSRVDARQSVGWFPGQTAARSRAVARHGRVEQQQRCLVRYLVSTKGPSWGYPSPALPRSWSHFVGLYCQKLIRSTFEYPHEGPCVERGWHRN